MIERQSCTVTFISSGFTLESTFQPLTGITAVVGENGIGKTFSTIELTRYLLYGKKALRGPASGYKSLKAEGDYTIRGEQYHIERHPDHESITDAKGTVLAVGAKAVTEKVTELMGYDLDVFDICNASVQGKTHLFSDKQPAERKRMIDQVVGLASNETVEKACRTEATMLRREVEALTRALVVPVQPTAKFSGQLSNEIEAELTQQRELTRKRTALEGKLVQITQPTKPDMPQPNLADIELLQKHQEDYQEFAYHARRLKDILDAPFTDPEYTSDQLEAAQTRLDHRKRIEAAGPSPMISLEQIEQAWQQWALHDNHVASDEVTCPNCQHHFHPTGETPPMPEWSKHELRQQTQRHQRWTGLDADVPDGPDLTRVQINKGWDALRALESRRMAQEEQNALKVVEDRSDQLNTLLSRQTRWNRYLEDQLVYERAQEANRDAQRELDKLPESMSEEDIFKLTQDLAEQRLFESQWAAWDKQNIAYLAAVAEIEDKRTLAEEYKRGGEALADARATIKAFLAPALSRVASSLLYDMTGGKLSSVTIDDDMNILVGSQTLETLSGGGLTAANIALRIALGQVLVADTFPVFLGDEIDADIDSVRREAVVESLVGLKDHLQQIILVTHRDVSVADHVFEVTK